MLFSIVSSETSSTKLLQREAEKKGLFDLKGYIGDVKLIQESQLVTKIKIEASTYRSQLKGEPQHPDNRDGNVV